MSKKKMEINLLSNPKITDFQNHQLTLSLMASQAPFGRSRVHRIYMKIFRANDKSRLFSYKKQISRATACSTSSQNMSRDFNNKMILYSILEYLGKKS